MLSRIILALLIIFILGYSVTSSFAQSTYKVKKTSKSCEPKIGVQITDFHKEQARGNFGDNYEDLRVELCHNAAKVFPTQDIESPSLNETIISQFANRHNHMGWFEINKEVERLCLETRENLLSDLIPMINFNHYFNKGVLKYKNKAGEVLQVNNGDEFEKLQKQWCKKYSRTRRQMIKDLIAYNKENDIKLIRPIYSEKCKLMSPARPVRPVMINIDNSATSGTRVVVDGNEPKREIKQEPIQSGANELTEQGAMNQLSQSIKKLNESQQQVDQEHVTDLSSLQNEKQAPVDAGHDPNLISNSDKKNASEKEGEQVEGNYVNPLVYIPSGKLNFSENVVGVNLNKSSTENQSYTADGVMTDKTDKGLKNSSGKLNVQNISIAAASAMLLSAASHLSGQ